MFYVYTGPINRMTTMPARRDRARDAREPRPLGLIMISVRASLTLCVLLLRAISARARVAFGRWILDDPFPQFRSHGRINVTGSGNFRA
jgi:hypothetical protein